MQLLVLPQRLSVIKLSPEKAIPSWVRKQDKFTSITYTEEELSVVCSEESIPENFDGIVESGWCCIKVVGELDFSLTGILASLATTLAKASVSIFALSTYNTDYILVKSTMVERAVVALEADGHHIDMAT